jgi:uncharacterized coiled-coil protein SlyX
MEEQKKGSKCTLVERAFALPGSRRQFGMKIADHKLICNVLDDHLDDIMGKVDEKILKTLQSDELTNTIAEKVYDKLAEFNVPVLLKLEALINGQAEIAKDITHIKERLQITEGRITIEEQRINDLNARLLAKKLRLEKLEIAMSLLQPEAIKQYANEIHEIKPILTKMVNAFKWWKIVIYCGVLLGIFMLIHYYWLK